MTDRPSEAILKALLAALTAAAPAGAVVVRGETLPVAPPAAGHLNLRDGDPGEPEVTLSPVMFHYHHRAEVDVVIGPGATDRDAAFNAAVRAIGTALAADRTLGGLCDWVEGESPAPLALAIEGAEGIKAATVAVILHYATTDTLT